MGYSYNWTWYFFARSIWSLFPYHQWILEEKIDLSSPILRHIIMINITHLRIYICYKIVYLINWVEVFQALSLQVCDAMIWDLSLIFKNIPCTFNLVVTLLILFCQLQCNSMVVYVFDFGWECFLLTCLLTDV